MAIRTIFSVLINSRNARLKIDPNGKVKNNLRREKLASCLDAKVSINNDRPYLLVLLLQGELLLLHLLQLIAEVELRGFLLKLRKFVLVFRHLLQGWFHAREGRESALKIFLPSRGFSIFLRLNATFIWI